MQAPNFSRLPTGRIRQLSDYVQRVLDISDEVSLPYGNLWYRGIANKKLELVPGVMWRRLLESEDALIEEFRISMPAYSNKAYLDAWENYAFMQHHGLPTRLLDWTKSPLAALFFALDVQQQQNPKHVPVVWVLNPYALNQCAHGREVMFVPSGDYGSDEDSTLENSYLPGDLRPRNRALPPRKELPIAIEPPFSNARLLAQQGCFTVHGSSALPLNKVPGLAQHMIALEIAPAYAGRLRSDLEQVGFRAEWLYQDLDRLSRRIIEERSR